MTDKAAYVRVLVPAALYKAAKKAAHTRYEQVEINETDAK